MPKGAFISVVIPSRNAEATIGECLRAALGSSHGSFEVVVVDDASTDGSKEIVRGFPCRLVELKEHAGVSKARNKGAENSKGDILLFIDADCLLEKDALSIIAGSMDGGTVLGGTYTPIPFDSSSFFSTFQSIFVNYHETRGEPDYIAAHCLAIDKNAFNEVGGFIEDSYMGVAAGVEDVELSHRLRKAGYRLRMNSKPLVRHVFNFDFRKSMANAYRKSMVWTRYSLSNKDWLRDSGTASRGLKVNVLSYFVVALLALLFLAGIPYALLPIPFFAALGIMVNGGLISSFYRVKGFFFAFRASAYYFLVYPLAVGLGSFAGLLKYLGRRK